jgi:hypothetical protein
LPDNTNRTDKCVSILMPVFLMFNHAGWIDETSDDIAAAQDATD